MPSSRLYISLSGCSDQPYLPVFAVLAALLPSACQQTDDSPQDCASGKCDQLSPPTLEKISLGSVIECDLVPDTDTTDPFFQVDRVICRSASLPPNSTVSITDVFIDLVRDDDSISETTHLREEQLGSEAIEVASFHGDGYPVTLRATVSYAVADHIGFAGAAPTLQSVFHAGHAQIEERSARTILSLEPPFDLWEVGIWPGGDLAEALSAGGNSLLIESLDYRFLVESAALNVGGPSPVEEMRYRREVIFSSNTPAFAAHVIHLLVPNDDMAPGAALKVRLSDSESTSMVDGPGYYLLSLDGSATLTAPADLPNLPSSVGVDAGAVDPFDASPPLADPCAGTCPDTESCVAEQCVVRSEQNQSTSCFEHFEPSKACDLNENEDCADGHACALGLCRRLSCQTQSTSCFAPSGPCDDDDNADCAADHACVAGLCRRLSCQTQSTSCFSASSPCDDGDDLDCAPAHHCAEDLCQRDTCTQ